MVRKIISLIVVIMLVLSFTNISVVNAGSLLEEIETEGDKLIDKGKEMFEGTGIEVTEITDVILPIAKALTTIGVGILLCVAAVMGIKWLTANPEEQAKLKQQSIGLVVAAGVIFGAYTIWSIALRIFNQF